MIGADVLTLISERPRNHGVFDEPETYERQVFCDVRSVGMQEYYRARELGLNPTLVFELADRAEYHGEKRCVFHNMPYDIVRTYIDGLKVELTAEEAKNA